MRLLTRLGCDVDITIRKHGKAVAPRNTIRLPAASVSGHWNSRIKRSPPADADGEITRVVELATHSTGTQGDFTSTADSARANAY